MNDFIIMTEVPGPNVWRTKHGRREVVASTLVNCYFAVILSVRRAQSICAEVRRVTREMMTVLVVQNAGIVRGVRAIRPTCGFYQCSMLEQISTWTEMDFPVWRNGFMLVQIVMLRRQPVVSALKGQPTITAPQAITNAFSLCHCMVGIY